MDREKAFVLEDEKGSKSYFYPSLAAHEYEYIRHWKDTRSPTFSKMPDPVIPGIFAEGLSSFLGIDEEQGNGLNQRSDGLPGIILSPDQVSKLIKIISARKILKDLNQHYERLFKEEFSSLGREMSEKQVFFNSNLLYFIAATDSTEDNLGHSQYVASYSVLLAKALGIEDAGFICDLERGALLHDIGKIGVPEYILKKAGPLTTLEREIVKDHPLIGFKMIEEFGFLRPAAEIVLYHHESFDGSGYPYGLAQEEIPLGARIFALADSLDAITSDRPYRSGRPLEEAFREVERCAGRQFDPMIVEVFLSIPKKTWERTKIETQNSLRLPSIH